MSTWMLPEKSYPADKYEFRVKYKGTSAACPQIGNKDIRIITDRELFSENS